MRQANTKKKNSLRSMVIVALLLVLVAVIGFGGYTLSKYVGNRTANGTAQVAKWGYTLQANSNDLFGKNYAFDTNNSVVTDDGADLTVSASGDANVVAPGTTGSMSFSVNGKAEVKAKLSLQFTVTSDISLSYTKDGVAGTYNPVKWTLKKGATTLVDGKSLDEVATELNKNDYDVTFDANGDTINDEYTLSWVWDFEEAGNADKDALDTLLGMIANDGSITTNGDYTATASNTTIAFSLNISVEQLAR